MRDRWFVIFILMFWSSVASAQSVVVSIPSLLQLTRKIVPPGTTVTSFVPAGAAPETFEPTPSLISKLAGAQYFVASGAPFERVWLPKIRKTHPSLVVIDAFGAADAPAEASASHSKAKGGHHHEHDPHLWLSLPLLKTAAVRISAPFAVTPKIQDRAGVPAAGAASGGEGVGAGATGGDTSAQQSERLAKVTEEIDGLDRAVRATLGAHVQTHQKFFVFHPSWGEFAKVFGLEQVALENEGHLPSPSDLKAFLALMKVTKAKVIYGQPQFSLKDATSAANHVGAKVVVVDPLAEDQFGEIQRFAQLLRADFDDRK